MVGDSLNLVEIVPLISDPTITPKEIVDILAMAVTTTLEDDRILVLQLLVLQPLLSLRPHDGLELIPDQVDRTVEVGRQVYERLDTLVLNILDNSDGILLHQLDLRTKSLHVIFQPFSLCQDG